MTAEEAWCALQLMGGVHSVCYGKADDNRRDIYGAFLKDGAGHLVHEDYMKEFYTLEAAQEDCKNRFFNKFNTDSLARAEIISFLQGE